MVGDLGGLGVGGLGVVGDVPVGADHEVPGRVGVEVEQHERELAARGLYRRWAEVMGAQSWADLAPRGMGEVASHG